MNANNSLISETVGDVHQDSGGDVCVSPAPSEQPDSWEAISAQLDYWADMDREYWRQRKEKEYTSWLERNYRI